MTGQRQHLPRLPPTEVVAEEGVIVGGGSDVEGIGAIPGISVFRFQQRDTGAVIVRLRHHVVAIDLVRLDAGQVDEVEGARRGEGSYRRQFILCEGAAPRQDERLLVTA